MLLGREAERLALDRLLAEARGGRSGVLALVGEPGIGKTALLEYAGASADGMRVLRARGVESEGEVPFAGLAELLRPALGALDRIPAPQASALAGALALAPATAQDRFAIGAATLSLLSAFAEELPLALLLDDAHLLDDSSSVAIRFAALEALRSRGIADVDLSPAPELVEAYLRLGRTDEARSEAAGFIANAATKGQPWALARAARCRGLMAESGELESAFEGALALHARTPDAFELGRTRLAYGSCLRRSRKRVRAREELRAALEIFDQLGAHPWADQASAELAATGETARRRDPSTLDQLTPQELQIARLLAGGRTTREAAAALF